MWNPFKKTKARRTGETKTTVQRPFQPLPYYDWGRHVRSLGLFEHVDEHMDVWDAQADAKADPDSAEKQETVADLLMCRTQTWSNNKVGFYFDSSEILRAINKAISLTPLDQPDQLLRCESKLAMFYERRYGLKGDVSDLRSGIPLAQRVVAQTPDSDSTKPFRLTCLANLLAYRFEREGNLDDAHSAVRFAAEAAELGEQANQGDDGNKDVVSRLKRNLSVKLEMRSSRTGSLSDLEQAIQLTEQALDLVTARNPDRLRYISEAGNMRAIKFQKSKDIRDLMRGIAAMERATSATPKGDAGLPRLLDNQANGYLERYEWGGDKEDLKLAVDKAEAAYNAQFLLDRNHPDMGRYITSTARKYALRAQISNRLWDEGLTATFSKRALNGLIAGHPGRAEVLECSADALALAFKGEARVRPEVREEVNRRLQTQQPSFKQSLAWNASRRPVVVELVETPSRNLEKAMSLYRQAACLENGHPFTRIRACKKMGDLKLKNMEWDDAANAYEMAISLWPRLNPRTLARGDMEYVVSKLSGLGPLAAHCMCRSKARRSAEEALQALESGRGVIASLTIDVSDLKREYGELYDGYIELCHVISSPLLPIGDTDADSKVSVAAAISQRNQEVEDLKLLERQIRSKPGFESFPRTRSTTEFTQLAGHGPIVCFSTTGNFTVAFIVTTARVAVIPLNDIETKDLQGHVKLLVRGKSPTSVAASKKAANNKRVCESLQWLWIMAVEPVLQHLGLIQEAPPERLPRIWWVTSGLLGLLPLHAAGSGWRTSRDNTMSHVVSSYVPTFRALAYVRAKRPRPLGDAGTELLVVSVPKTEGYKELDVKPEVDGVMQNFQQGTVRGSVLLTPSRKEALDRLKSANIAHFICHGVSEATTPSAGGLELGDGRLTIHDVGSLSLDHVQIAYLSACSTAQNKNSDIVDETIAVASAFNLVGFPHVIGTLWEASDRIAGKVAPRFYKMLADNIQQGFGDNAAVAYALHRAVASLWEDKKNGQGRVDEWVPFIHIGA
ncbi:CHAT domain-containing protein [Hirsutella rhossiliensis]|uniref:CHAT domain-containing protein n=1 Tax=Hirsutella rhossiliensis TaxID=111463 RepID=A0A9P8MWZ6_9HYPO|nr:CHAT domain-containing protein [Hirsutella rhossiliensis]KAH0962897.1 CHAT domain-containing protein [Hirsutella rhossiliensis]